MRRPPVATTTALFALPLVLIAASGGCEIFGALGGGDGLACSDDKACSSGLICVDRQCQRPLACNGNDDCRTTHGVCRNGVCVAAGDAGPAADAASTDRPLTYRTVADRTTTDRTAIDRTAIDRTAIDRTAIDRTIADRTMPDHIAIDAVVPHDARRDSSPPSDSAAPADSSQARDASGNWYDPAWSYRQPISVSVASGSAPAGYQVQVQVTVANAGANFSWGQACADLRFIADSDLPYWVEKCDGDGASASVWVKMPAEITTTPIIIHMYYGCSTATNRSSGNATFEFYEDFEDGNFTSDPTWNHVDFVDYCCLAPSIGSATVHSGLYSMLEYADHGMGYMWAPVSASGDRINVEWWWWSSGSGYGFTDWECGIYTADHTTKLANLSVGDNMVNDTASTVLANVHPVQQWMRSRVVYTKSTGKADHYVYYADGTLLGSSTEVTTVSMEPGAMRLSARCWQCAHTLYYDDVVIRKYVSPEPTATLGSEEAR